MKESMNRPLDSIFVRSSLLALVYFATAQIGLQFALVGNAVTLFWPPSGIALAAILLGGNRYLPAVLVGAFFSNLTSGMSLLAVAGMTLGATLEAWLGAWLLGRYTRFNLRLSEVRDIYRLGLYGGALSTLSSAFIGAASLYAAGAIQGGQFFNTALFWWMGDALGVILFVPAVMAYVFHKPMPWTRAQIVELFGLLLAIVSLTTLVFGHLGASPDSGHVGLFMLFPLIVWAALSFNQRCVSGLLIVMFLIAVLYTLNGIGPFADNGLRGVIDLWLYITFLSVLGISVSALNYQRTHTLQQLQVSKDALSRAQAIGKVGSWQLDIRTNRLEWSDETYRIFGMTSGGGLSYETFLAHVHPDDRESLDRHWAEALKSGSYDVEHRILVDGKVRWVHEQARFDFDLNNGRPVFAIGTVHDTTAQKEEQAALRLAARVFESSGEAILITDAQTNVVAVNHAFIGMSGYRTEDMLGKNPRILASGRHDEEFYRAMWDDITTSGYWQGEIWDKHKNGRIYPKWMSITAVRDANGEVAHYISIARDTTEQTEAEKNIHLLAYFDVLTGLPNRTLLRDRLGQLIAVSHRDQHQFALLFMDLDRFKYINDSMGHTVGDRLLQAVALRIQAHVREEDTVARLGGDEFIVLLRETDESGAAVVSVKLLESLAAPYDLDGQLISTQASIGISIYPDHAHDADTLIKNADMAMYRAKEEGRNNYQFFRPEMNFRVDLLFSMEKDLRLALERGEFFLHYQPQVDLATGKLCGVEALIRWHHPEKGAISPAEFIPVAEETGQIIAIGEWVLRTACAQLVQWRKEELNDFTLSVNLSMRQLRQPILGEQVRKVLTEFELEPRFLELEITEGIMMGDNMIAMNFLGEMHALGVMLSIDDFGTGFSSLNYLKKLPVHKLKIDQSFVRDIESDESDAAIIRSIIALGHRLNLRVIAEGVETQDQLDFLRIRGCDEIQGYFYSRPLSPEDIARFIRNPPRLA
ncbi:MAG: EAL domain-containing protein [Nitrosomonadales bacterium]|nr:EAL domain-containing protein [Nitrosomonadales bacterium]